MFCSRDRMILTYSINGQLIQRLHEKDSGSLLVPTLIRDARSLEIVVSILLTVGVWQLKGRDSDA